MKMRPTLAGQETNSPGTEAKLAPVKAVNSNFMEFDESFTDSDNYQETRARSQEGDPLQFTVLGSPASAGNKAGLVLVKIFKKCNQMKSCNLFSRY